MRLIYFTKKHQQCAILSSKTDEGHNKTFYSSRDFNAKCMLAGDFFFSLSRASPFPTLKFISHSVCLSVDLINIFFLFRSSLTASHMRPGEFDGERNKLEQGMFPMKSSCKVHLFYIKDQLLRLQILTENARRN